MRSDIWTQKLFSLHKICHSLPSQWIRKLKTKHNTWRKPIKTNCCNEETYYNVNLNKTSTSTNLSKVSNKLVSIGHNCHQLPPILSHRDTKLYTSTSNTLVLLGHYLRVHECHPTTQVLLIVHIRVVFDFGLYPTLFK